MSAFRRVAVVGAGLIGGSLARRLASVPGCSVVVVDPDVRTLESAARAGLVVASVVPADSDLVVAATPLDLVVEVLTATATAAPEALLVDVGSAKAAVQAGVDASGLGHRFVGCHPMAGTEGSGFGHSDPDLLVGATWAVTYPAAAVPDGDVARVVGFLVESFAATVLYLDPVAHDRAVALVSHAPHVLAHALLDVLSSAADSPAAPHLAAGSFRSGTRVAGRNPQRTFNMLVENTPDLRWVLDELIGTLSAYRADLDDPAALRARLEASAAAAGAVRHPDVAWASTTDPLALLASARAGGSPLLLRRHGDWEWATPGPSAPGASGG